MRDPYRRAALIVLLLGWVTYSAWRTTALPWFWGPTPQYPQGGPVDQLTLATTALVANPVGGQPATYQILGTPAPVGWLIIGGLLAGLAFVLRLSVLGVFALAATWMSRSAAVGAYSMLVARNQRRSYQLVEANFDAYLSKIWLVLLLQGVLVAQIAYSGHVARRTALERGRTPQDGVLDTFHNVTTGAIGRFSRPPAGTSRHQ